MTPMRHLTARLVPGIALLALVATAAQGQSSDGYDLDEHVFNGGGRPADGVTASSASYRISLDAIGEPVANVALTSPSYSVTGGFTSAYPPPGEVMGLRFSSRETLVWDPERSVGAYNLYRGGVDTLPDEEYGSCHEPAIPHATTDDPEIPSPPGDGYFYLVTARNRLAEEGPKGWNSAGAERPNPAPCP